MKRETEEKATPEIIYFVDGGGRRFAERRPTKLSGKRAEITSLKIMDLWVGHIG